MFWNTKDAEYHLQFYCEDAFDADSMNEKNQTNIKNAYSFIKRFMERDCVFLCLSFTDLLLWNVPKIGPYYEYIYSFSIKKNRRFLFF